MRRLSPPPLRGRRRRRPAWHAASASPTPRPRSRSEDRGGAGGGYLPVRPRPNPCGCPCLTPALLTPRLCAPGARSLSVLAWRRAALWWTGRAPPGQRGEVPVRRSRGSSAPPGVLPPSARRRSGAPPGSGHRGFHSDPARRVDGGWDGASLHLGVAERWWSSSWLRRTVYRTRVQASSVQFLAAREGTVRTTVSSGARAWSGPWRLPTPPAR